MCIKSPNNQTFKIVVINVFLKVINTSNFHGSYEINLLKLFISYSGCVGMDRNEFNFVFHFLPENLSYKQFFRVRRKER